jgi:pSer/pThr/pTyr-binding forkhead associated (FHA) protein
MAAAKSERSHAGRSRLFGLRHRLRVLVMPGGIITIGRRSTCELVLDDMQVSREHARIIIGAETAAIEDLGSANGVYVNDEKISGLQQLRDGDRIRVGQQVIEVLGFSHTGPGAYGDTEPTYVGADASVDASFRKITERFSGEDASQTTKVEKDTSKT